jgi:TM2 domain-containing membrane protein YozV
MAICPGCGKNTPEGKFCESCGASLQAVPAAIPQPPPAPAGVKKKNVIAAAVGSAVWAGAGQTYNGQTGKGLAIWFALFLFYVLNTEIHGGLFILLVLIVWVYGIHDAYATAKKMNSGDIPFADTDAGKFIGFIIGAIFIAVFLTIFQTTMMDIFYNLLHY